MIDFGNTLRQAREAKGLTISQLAAKTRLTVQAVNALESENFSVIVAPIYGRGFVKLYCEAVGIDDPQPLVREFMAIYSGTRPKSSDHHAPPKRPAPADDLFARVPEPRPAPVPRPVAAPAVEPEPVVESAPEPVSAPDDGFSAESVVPAESASGPASEPYDDTPGIASVSRGSENPFAEIPSAQPRPVRDMRTAEPSSQTDSDLFGFTDEPTVRVVPHPHPSAGGGAAPGETAEPPRRYVPARRRNQTVAPKLPWRLVLVILFALVLLWMLVAGIRALYHAATGTSNGDTAASQAAESGATGGANPARIQQEIPPLYID